MALGSVGLVACTSKGNTMSMRRHDSAQLYFYKQNSRLHKVSREKQHLLWSWSQCLTGPTAPFFIKGKTPLPFLWVSAFYSVEDSSVLLVVAWKFLWKSTWKQCFSYRTIHASLDASAALWTFFFSQFSQLLRNKGHHALARNGDTLDASKIGPRKITGKR